MLRWQRPSGEFEPPGEFIPIAERSDLMLAVDRWVLSQAAAQLQEWTGHPQLGKLSVSVNLSARHLTVPTLVRDVLGPLRTRNVDPHRLTVELTETALLGDLNRAARGLGELRAAGVRVAIDDFGTGYASLAHLRQLPIDILKIDQSFVAGIDRHDDRSLVQLTIDTGHLLGAAITAEGVETGDRARQLTTMGTDLLQGFGTGRPMPPAHLEAWAAMTGGTPEERIRNASVADAN